MASKNTNCYCPVSQSPGLITLTESTMKGAPASSSWMQSWVRPEAATLRSLSAISASRPVSMLCACVKTDLDCRDAASRLSGPHLLEPHLETLSLQPRPGWLSPRFTDNFHSRVSRRISLVSFLASAKSKKYCSPALSGSSGSVFILGRGNSSMSGSLLQP